jgi:hypothetical protein
LKRVHFSIRRGAETGYCSRVWMRVTDVHQRANNHPDRSHSTNSKDVRTSHRATIEFANPGRSSPSCEWLEGLSPAEPGLSPFLLNSHCLRGRRVERWKRKLR